MKKQLFIGLGGQGAKSIREIRKVIYERQLNAKANPNAAPCDIPCAYLSIDTSGDIWKAKDTWTHMGKDLSLSMAERCELKAQNLNISAANTIPWLYSHDHKISVDQHAEFGSINTSTPGAQQRRRYGRALFAANAEGPAGVHSSVVHAMQRLNTVNAENECVISVFCSLAGGTGSGGIVDLITLLRQQYPSGGYPINLYVYLADANGVNPEDVQGYFYENQYAALRDLNALSTGLMQPHMLTVMGNSPYLPGERCKVDSPLDAIIISSNTTSANVAISIDAQIRRVAEWVVDRAAVTSNTSDPAILKIATGEDFSTNTHGEPNDTSDVFLERAYRFASLGAAKWEAPVNQLSLMAVYSIMANSFRQMLYNNPTQTEGYKPLAVSLDDKSKANFNRIGAEDFLLHDYVREGWAAWAASQADLLALQNVTWDASGQRALIKMEEVFESFYNMYVLDATSNAAGDALSQPGRVSKMMANLKEKLKLENSSATSVHEILNDFLMRKLVADWTEGRIGLEQAKEVLGFAAQTARACRDLLEKCYEDILDDGKVMQPMLLSKELRSQPETGEWNKLTALSFKVKGKEFLKAHLEDLIDIYTAKTQRAHLLTFRQELDLYAAALDKFIIRMDTPINALKVQIDAAERKYQDMELRRYIMGGDRPGLRDLEFDFDLQDPKVKDVVNYVNGHNLSGSPVTTVTNAAAIRAVVKESLTGGSTLADLFGGASQMDASTEGKVMSLAYELAGNMLRHADAYVGTKLMDGLVSRVKNMTPEDIKAKFRRLLTNATFSYKEEDAGVSPSSYTGYGIHNAYRTAWIVSYPRDIELPGIGQGKANLEAAVLAATNGAGESAVFVVPSSDNTKISVWQTEFARPARCAKVVSFLRQRYDELIRSGSLQSAFWLHIDDLAAEMEAPVTFPNSAELQSMRDGAIWVVRHCKEAFVIDEQSGDIYSADGERNLYNFKELSDSQSKKTLFAFAVQKTLRTLVKDGHPELLTTLKQQYEEDLKSLPVGEPRKAFRAQVNNFIKPTLYRIAKAEKVRDYLQQYGVKPL